MSPTPGWLDLYIRLLNARLPRRLALEAARLFVRHAPRLPGLRLAERVRRFLLEPASCCAPGGNQVLLTRRFFQLLEGSLSGARIGAWFARGDRERVAARLEALVRVSLFGLLRHHVLNDRRDRMGRPATVLLDAMISPYADCPLDCAGCYTREERTAAHGPSRAGLGWLVDQAAACGAMAVYVVGKGEPFLPGGTRSADLLAVAHARPHLLFVVATAGIAIGDELARRIAAVPNLFLLVSVEGSRRVHEERRGRGTYDRVRRGLDALHRHGAFYGFACMVGRNNHLDVTEPGFVRDLADAGCVLGVYSRYFPLSPGGWEQLGLAPDRVREFCARREAIQPAAAVPLVDLDDLEAHSGCRSRAGVSIYLDGTNGAVSPCIRVPFAPPDCRLDPAGGMDLATVLAGPFFRGYREAAGRGRAWCGADLAGELSDVARELDAHGVRSERLGEYRDRAAAIAHSTEPARVP